MQRAIFPQHPALELGPLQIPGPVIPFALLCLPFLMSPRTRRRVWTHPGSKEYLEYSLITVHLLLYICNVREILNKTENKNGNTLSLLEYLALVLGETILQKSDSWRYTYVALGWALSASMNSPLTYIPPSSTRALISLLLSIPGAFGNSVHISTGVRLSALSLLTRATFWVLIASNVVREFSATTLAKLISLVLARLLHAKFVRTAHNQPWSSRLREALQKMFRIVQQDNTEQSKDCAHAAMAMQTLLVAGWILSSYLWSCFRWRWLFLEQASRAPAWTVFSFLGGTQFFTAWVLVKRSHAREPTGDLRIFAQRQLVDCLEATWWTSCFDLLLWSICELGREIMSRYK